MLPNRSQFPSIRQNKIYIRKPCVLIRRIRLIVLGLYKTHLFFIQLAKNQCERFSHIPTMVVTIYIGILRKLKRFSDRRNVINICYYLRTRYVSRKNENILLNLRVTCLLIIKHSHHVFDFFLSQSTFFRFFRYFQFLNMYLPT